MGVSIDVFTVAVAITVAAVLAPGANAWSTGAGTCVTTEEGPLFTSTAPHLNQGKGALDDGGFELTIEGAGVTTDGTTLTSGEEVFATISGSKAFKGFLVVVSGENDQNLSGSLFTETQANPIDSPVAQLMESTGAENGQFGFPAKCAEDVSGITHQDNKEKEKAEFVVSVKVGGEAKIDVTVMVSVNEWYFSRYPLEIVAPPSPSPTSAPTANPTEVPTITPTISANPTEVPTITPTNPSGSGATMMNLGCKGGLLSLAVIVASNIFTLMS